MANAKIISFVDHEVSRVIEETARELDAARDKATNDLRFVTVNLRHDIASLTDHVRDTRLALTNALADNTLTLRHDINTLAAAINKLRTDLDALATAAADTAEAHRRAIEQLQQGGEPPKAK